MKRKIVPLLLACVMVLSMTSMAFGNVPADTAQDQDQTQTQTQDQIRLQLREQLCITDSAIQMQQERQRTMTRTQFSDVTNHWAVEPIRNAWTYRLFEGYPDGNFHPNTTISGIECLVVTNRLMNCISGLEPGNITPGAVDWDGIPDWARVQLQEQNTQRLMTQTNYYQDPLMNRAHIAVMLAKALQIEPFDQPIGTETQFRDQNRIAEQDLGYILALRNLGILKGYPDGTYQPDNEVTRAELAVMMSGILEMLE